MKYKLIDANEEILHSKLEDFDFENPPVDPIELAKDLREIMTESKGVGLAANQVGLNHRVCVFNCTPQLTMYNPVIVYYDSVYKVASEGCLSHPNLFVKIRRPDTIRVRYKDEHGQLQTKALNGMMSRVVQHEVDHLNGIDFTERASEYHLKEAKKKVKLFKRKLKKLESIL